MMVSFLTANKRNRAAFFSILLIIFTAACSDKPDDPRHQIKILIDQVEAAAEKSSVKSFSEHVSEQYKDKYHDNRQQAMRSVLGYFHRNRNIHLFTRISSIEINEQVPDSAKASVNVAMTGTQVDSAEQLLLLKASIYRFDLDLRKEDDQWMISSAAWQRIQAREFLD